MIGEHGIAQRVSFRLSQITTISKSATEELQNSAFFLLAPQFSLFFVLSFTRPGKFITRLKANILPPQSDLDDILPFIMRGQHPPGRITLAFTLIQQGDKVAFTAVFPQIPHPIGQ